ncbi:MAG: hypothetical protein AB7U41_00720 [Dongiaceae bacterium]
MSERVITIEANPFSYYLSAAERGARLFFLPEEAPKIGDTIILNCPEKGRQAKIQVVNVLSVPAGNVNLDNLGVRAGLMVGQERENFACQQTKIALTTTAGKEKAADISPATVICQVAFRIEEGGKPASGRSSCSGGNCGRCYPERGR